MSRAFSLTTVRALMEEQSGDWIVMLLTLNHDDLSEPIRVSSDPTQRVGEVDGRIVYGTVSRSATFTYYPVTMALPSDEEGSPPSTTLEILADKEVLAKVRALTSPPSVHMELVMGSAPDVVEMSQPDFALIRVSYDMNTITGEITVDFLANEPLPAGRYRPGSHPGAFK